MLRTFLLAAILAFSSVHLEAQRPTRHDCRVALNKFNSDPHSAAFRWALTYGRLHQCGPEGAEALARRVSRLDEVADTTLLRAIILQAAGSRHPQLAESALSAAANPVLRERSRLAAMQIALALHDPGLWLPASDRLDPARPCIVRVVPGAEHGSSTELPPNYLMRLIALAARLEGNTTEPPRIRAAAKCVLGVTRDLRPLEPL